MRKCIFICVFNNEKYVNMTYLLLESIYRFGNIKEDTDILIYTSTVFMNMIKNSNYNGHNLVFEINDNIKPDIDNYMTIYNSCRSRLDLFYLKSVSNYDKILYLDTDVLIKGDINPIFDLAKEDILYTLEEGQIDNPNTFWGNILFGKESEQYEDKTAFTTGILLFKNCEKMKFLFNKINEDTVQRPYRFCCLEQPFIIYNAFKFGMYNNKILKDYAINHYFTENNVNPTSSKIIHHFPGGQDLKASVNKLVVMTKFLVDIKKNLS